MSVIRCQQPEEVHPARPGEKVTLEAPLSNLGEAAAAALLAYEVRLGAHTDPGQARKENEDRLLVFDPGRRRAVPTDETIVAGLHPHGILLMVADGMGGMSAGEQASQMCVDLLPEKLMNRLGTGTAATREEWRQALVEAVREVNQIIFRQAASDVRLHGMGCTLTAAVLTEDHAIVAQVGDSRAYLGRAGEVTQLTRDQTVWESLRAEGKDPETTLGQSQFKSMLLQAVGAQDGVQVVITELALQAEDWLVLCSDGLHRVVSTEEIRQVLETRNDPAEKARALTALANQHGAPDNVSVIACQVTSKVKSGVRVAA